MTIIIRSNDIFSDPRAMKYVEFQQEEKLPYTLIGWDRDGKLNSINKERGYFFERRAGFNVGGIKAVINRVYWMFYVLKTLHQLHAYNDTLHGCDLDSAFPAAVYKWLCGKKAQLIFDVFDWFSATLYNQRKYILWAFKHMEKFTIKEADKVIICEPERIEQIPYPMAESKLEVLPNIPFFKSESFLKFRDDCHFNNNLITFAYVGGFYGERCIREIIEIAAAGHINLLIAGFGEPSYINLLNQLKDSPYIKYFGKVDYQDALSIMYNADIIYAMYATSNPNHIYAAPNKFYESMFLGKPIFTTCGTIMEKKVRTNQMGYISGENTKQIMQTIDSITSVDLQQKGDNAHKLWINNYQNYTHKFMEEVYRTIIHKV